MGYITPLNLSLGTYNTRSINGVVVSGHHIGIVWPKGVYFHLFGGNIFISKDGVNQYLQRCYGHGEYGHFLTARFVALLETILMFIALPFMLVAYLILTLSFFCAGFVLFFTLPFEFDICCNKCFGLEIASNRTACGVMWILFLDALIAIMYAVVYIILSPFQIIVPEFTQLLLQYHKWKTTPFAYL